MARKNENSRHSKFILRIVCEGDKTEPLFFSDLCNAYYADDEYVDFRTIPQPYTPEENNAEDQTTRGWHKSKKRKVRDSAADAANAPVICGQPPLKWVLYARQLLSEGVDEAWAVYDKDEHPMHKEAFEEASKVVDGKFVNIAFSSRSFEYYLLLHFEYLYYAFAQTECGERIDGKKLIYECGTGKFPDKECNGKNCINGYARTRGYWTETKSDESTFPLVKDRLLIGLINACRLREQSNSETDAPIYERNPYTDVDKLVGRLIGKSVIPFGNAYGDCLSGVNRTITLTENGIEIENLGERTDLFARGSISALNLVNGNRRILNETTFITAPHEKSVLECTIKNAEIVCVRVSSGKEIILLPNGN